MELAEFEDNMETSKMDRVLFDLFFKGPVFMTCIFP